MPKGEGESITKTGGVGSENERPDERLGPLL
jgi:hypothetical protein